MVRKLDDFRNITAQVFVRMFLNAKDKIPDLVQHIVHSLACLIIVILQIKIFIDKFIEILAALFIFRLHTAAPGLVHALVQHLQLFIESSPTLLSGDLPLNERGFRHLFAHTHNGIETGHGILENHGDFVSPQPVEFLLRNLHQITAVIDDLAGLFYGISCKNPHDGAVCHRFSGSALAHQRQCLPLVQIKINTADSLYLTAVRAEGYFQIIH